MINIRTTIQDRRIDVPAPDDLPDGTEVLVQLQPVDDKTGLDESEWDDSPEAIDEWLAWLDTLEPINLTDEDVAAIEADRKARKQWEKQRFEAHGDELAKEWE